MAGGNRRDSMESVKLISRRFICLHLKIKHKDWRAFPSIYGLEGAPVLVLSIYFVKSAQVFDFSKVASGATPVEHVLCGLNQTHFWRNGSLN